MLVLLCFAAIGARLIYLQIINHAHFTTLSEDNRIRLDPIPPTRGLIYDRNGILLADNLATYRLEITPEQVEDLDATLIALDQVMTIGEIEEQQFRKNLKNYKRFERVPLLFRLSEKEVARFAAHRHQFPGVEIRPRLQRHYPYGLLTSHIIGYVGRISSENLKHIDTSQYKGTTHIGKIGIEKTYEEILHGEVGYQHVETNVHQRDMRIIKQIKPVPGNNLHLHLDIKLQGAAYAALGEHSGAVIAIDTQTGGVLAFISKPGYDPNAFVNGISHSEYQLLRQSEEKPLFNRALRGQYPPGSTIKPFIGLAGLELGVRDIHSRSFCPGYFQIKKQKHKYRCWKRYGHGHANLTHAIKQSCDIYFYALALDLGIDRIHQYMANFGFGEKTGLDLIGEKPGLNPSREWKREHLKQPWYPGETVIVGIGQGSTKTTPLQLATATAILARRGQRLQPRIVNAIQEAGYTGPLSKPQTLPQLSNIPIVNPDNWEHIIDAMIKVVHDSRGTARKAGKGAPYLIAGKTGTSQVIGIKQDSRYDKSKIAKKFQDHSLFISFAPADNPRIALAVIAENGGSGSKVAAPIARKILDYYLLESQANTP